VAPRGKCTPLAPTGAPKACTVGWSDGLGSTCSFIREPCAQEMLLTSAGSRDFAATLEPRMGRCEATPQWLFCLLLRRPTCRRPRLVLARASATLQRELCLCFYLATQCA